MNISKKLALMKIAIKLTKDISLDDIVEWSKTEVILDASDFRIDKHELIS